MPVFASMLAFITYALTNHGLNPARIFSSLALFNSLRMPLNFLPVVIAQTVDALVSIKRIQEYLLSEESTDDVEWDKDGEHAIEVKDADFTWERLATSVEEAKAIAAAKKIKDAKELSDRKAELKAESKHKNETKITNGSSGESTPDARPNSVVSDSLDSTSTLKDRQPFHLENINISIARNELIAVVGGVASGKSSLLAALAGDMRRTKGELKLGATRAFCPQYAWIQNATVKENVVFGKEFKKDWYAKVIEACALGPDLEMLPHGDNTEIGERGITVSGGQKQRLNIARAVYFDADIVLLDDPLSAVDAHVGRHLFDNAICGLLKDKCRILATHQLHVLSRCDRIIWMEDGHIQAFDSYKNLMETNAGFSAMIGSNAMEEAVEKDDEDEVESEKKDAKKSKKKGRGLMQAEERSVNSVPWSVYGDYFKASGNVMYAPMVIFILILAQGANISTSLWLSWWTSDKWGYSMGEYVGHYCHTYFGSLY
jgi:ATP-binding cassette, subfamily C (CFTR/MRP), member 1